MIRRISTKLLLAVLVAVAVPFVAFAIFVDRQMADRLAREVVLYSLKGLAADLSSQVDRNIDEHNRNVRELADDFTCDWAIREQDQAERTMRNLMARKLNTAVANQPGSDLMLLADYAGALVASSTRDAQGRAVASGVLEALAGRDYHSEPWFQVGLRGEASVVGPHRSELLPPANPAPGVHPENYHFAFSAPVFSERDRDQPIGVLYSLVNWRLIQDEIRQPVLKSYFQGLVGPEEFPSAYAWIWDSDADTIIAHEDPRLYGERVSGPKIDLPQMVADARAEDWGLYREYTFRGKRKNAAFKHTAPAEEGGFGWVVGVGIDNDDIFRAVGELRGLLFRATLVALLLAVLLTLVVARRTTGPILALQQHTRRVAAGDLDARVEVRTRDEIGELGEAFNRMTAELKEKRDQLVRAEKDAAWREMARQVAHDIKNPLTPIKLSADLLRRAKREKSPDFDRIFESTLDTISRQVEHLREIASDFHALTGAPKPSLEEIDAGALVDEVLSLDAAWAHERGIELARSGGGGRVLADTGLLRRALLNLVSNAIEAMEEGGRLEADVRELDGRVRIELRDTGPGVPEDVRPRLFEPYFTTRSAGTGLGLAIAKRVIEELGGTIELVPAEPGPGTVARVQLPSHRA